MKVNISLELDDKDDIQEVRLLLQSLKELAAELGDGEQKQAQNISVVQKSLSKQQETESESKLAPPYQESQMPVNNKQPVEQTPEYVTQIERVVKQMKQEDRAAQAIEWIAQNSNASIQEIGQALTHQLLSIQDYSDAEKSKIAVFTDGVTKLPEELQQGIKKEMVRICVAGLMDNRGDKTMIYNWSLVLAYATQSGLLGFEQAMKCVLKLLGPQKDNDSGILLLCNLVELMAEKVQQCNEIKDIRQMLESMEVKSQDNYELNYLRENLGWQ
eukprot:TRINITY_DN9102_c0_g1_i1.p1 TRINITY_DN9102_c0_g1~~TRINITY_DN9102_c0_g1_i1.p1  ORF type:complete len:272 (+),score=50.58 TRINITY_DN9102_c0_g1_i1:124-939(+)